MYFICILCDNDNDVDAAYMDAHPLLIPMTDSFL